MFVKGISFSLKHNLLVVLDWHCVVRLYWEQVDQVHTVFELNLVANTPGNSPDIYFEHH